MFYRTTAIAILLCWVSTADAHGSLRCKGRIIDTGELQETVLALCGTPSMLVSEEVLQRATNMRGYSQTLGLVTTDRWTYDRGYGRFPAVLTIDYGKVVAIEYLPFRTGD
jgi:hypothetical protein